MTRLFTISASQPLRPVLFSFFTLSGLDNLSTLFILQCVIDLALTMSLMANQSTSRGHIYVVLPMTVGRDNHKDNRCARSVCSTHDMCRSPRSVAATAKIMAMTMTMVACKPESHLLV